MKIINQIPLKTTGKFSSLFNDYVGNKLEVLDFYNAEPTLENLNKACFERKTSQTTREILHETLIKQYEKFQKSESLENALSKIRNTNTFTITTGHQLCLFTGPLYFIYKIVTTIKLAQVLNEKYPTYNYIPIYWMASEDHDFEEINHFNLYGKRFEWQTNQKGSVGFFETSEVKAIIELLPESKPLFEKAYLEHDNLADATRYLVNELFGEYGLIVVDGNDHSFKKQFKSFIINDLNSNENTEAVNKTSQNLALRGYDAQIKPREINLFYGERGIRERIIKEGNKFKVLNTSIEFSDEELMHLVETEPEKISPNVVLRPLYQEVILPNIAYVGGPGEIAYWLQLKQMFANQNIDFPILIPRNFALILNENQFLKLEKLGIEPKDLFINNQELKNKYLSQKQINSWELTNYKDEIDTVFAKIKSDAIVIDKTLEGFIESQKVESLKILENIAKKIKKSAENKEQEGLNQLANLKSKLFPNDELQERTENFLGYFNKNKDFIIDLINLFDPLDFSFNIMVQD